MIVKSKPVLDCVNRVAQNKESTCNAGGTGDTGSVPRFGKIPSKRKSQPTQVFLPGKSYGQKSLVGYSPWGHGVGQD